MTQVQQNLNPSVGHADHGHEHSGDPGRVLVQHLVPHLHHQHAQVQRCVHVRVRVRARLHASVGSWSGTCHDEAQHHEQVLELGHSVDLRQVHVQGAVPEHVGGSEPGFGQERNAGHVEGRRLEHSLYHGEGRHHVRVSSSSAIGVESGEFIMANDENTHNITSEYLIWTSIPCGFGCGQSHVMTILWHTEHLTVTHRSELIMQSLTHDGTFCISMDNSSPFPSLGVPSLYLPLGTVTERKSVDGKWCLSAAMCLSWSTRMMPYVALTVLTFPPVSVISSLFPSTTT